MKRKTKKILIYLYVFYILFLLFYYGFAFFSPWYFKKEIFALKYLFYFLFTGILPIGITIASICRIKMNRIKKVVLSILASIGITLTSILMLFILFFLAIYISGVEKNTTMYIWLFEYTQENNRIITKEHTSFHHSESCIYKEKYLFFLEKEECTRLN